MRRQHLASQIARTFPNAMTLPHVVVPTVSSQRVVQMRRMRRMRVSIVHAYTHRHSVHRMRERMRVRVWRVMMRMVPRMRFVFLQCQFILTQRQVRGAQFH